MAGGVSQSGAGTTNNVKIFANIFISFIGAGVLGLPYAFKEAGILEGAVIMTLVGVISVRAMLLLIDCKYRILQKNKKGDVVNEDGLYEIAHREEEKHDLLKSEGDLITHIKKPPITTDISYGDVGSEALGMLGRHLVDGAVVVSQIGFCCAYLIFICKNLTDFFPSVQTTQCLLIVLPPLSLLTLLRNLNSLAITSLLAQGSNLFAFGVVFWFDFEHLNNVSLHPKEISIENLPFFFAIAIYSYEGAGLILSLESSLAKEVRHKFNKFFIFALIVVTTLYITFGACGYLSFGSETNQIITLNLPKGQGFDFSMVVKACICVALFCTYPVMMFPVMKILERYFIPDANKSMWKGNVLRGLIVLLTGAVVLVIPNFADLMALIGASCCTLLAFIMPGIFHMKLFKGDLTRRQIMFDWFLIILGLTATILGLWDSFGRLNAPSEDVEILSLTTIKPNVSAVVTQVVKTVVTTALPDVINQSQSLQINLTNVGKQTLPLQFNITNG